MNPINPVESAAPETPQERAAAITQIMRTRYWQQRAHDAQSVRQKGKAEEAKTDAEDQKQRSDRVEAKQEEPVVETDPPPGLNDIYAEFETDEETRQIVVRIFDGRTGELVRTIPPDQLAEELARGDVPLERIRRRSVHA